MSDVFTKQKRSSIMAANRGSGNRSTELNLRVRLAANKISGWRLNAKDIFGKPDFVFDRERVAVFVDGCFWHGCKSCRNVPVTNRDFWLKKIEGNQHRDKAVNRKLRKDG
jgi:DNA mismatch endonuclease (patch repair protein)